MDKNSILGLAIIGVILFGFSWYGTTQEQKVKHEKAQIDSINRVELAKTVVAVDSQTVVLGQDSLRKAAFAERQQASLGETLYTSLQGEQQFTAVENDLMILTFSNKGARVASVELKDYKTYDGNPLLLFDKSTSKFDLSFFTNQQINTSNFYFTPSFTSNTKVTNKDGEQFSFKLYADSLSYIEYVYTVKSDSYMIGFKVNLVGMEHLISPAQTNLAIQWENVSPQQERGFDYENNYTTIAYMFPGETVREELNFSTETKEETINSKLKWVAFKQQFFSSIILARNDFQNGEVKFETMKPGSGQLKKFSANLTVPYTPQTTTYDFDFYFGPNNYTTLKHYGDDFQTLIPLGWGIFGWINRWLVIPMFNFLNNYIGNFGIIILILTVVIKLIIFPFTYKSYLSMAKMRLLKPEMDKISEKFPNKDDAMKKQQATMELYRSAGVSPMGGCLPLLFQMPVLIAMFRFFPASIELRQEHFLWANDLSSYDSILQLPFTIPFYGDHVSLFALLMGVSMFISSKLNFAQSNMSSSNQLPGMTFMTLYIMPIMLVVWFNSYSSGLSYYYFLSNLITIGQMYVFRYMVDDKKLHAEMKANAKKPKKKNKFQQRYDDMIKQQQEAARNQKKK